jgi:hypothetical protein
MGIRFALGVLGLFACGLVLSLPGTAQAQSVPLCRTTAGDDGVVFEGTFSLIDAPVAFASAIFDVEGVQEYVTFRHGRTVLVQAIENRPGRAFEPYAAKLAFSAADGAIVHECAVRVVAYDPRVHDPAQLQAGDCNLTVIAGLPHLVMGHAQVIEMPRAFEKAVSGAPGIVGLTPLFERRIYSLGKRPGMTVLAWSERKPTGRLAVNLCPVPVASPTEGFGPDGPGDDVLCRDEQGAPMRLAVGQTARMVFRDARGQAMKYAEQSVANPAVAGFRFEPGARAGTVVGLVRGSTSLTLLTLDGETIVTCEIFVE